MSDAPTWLGAIAALLVIAAALGAAVAVYRTNIQGTALRESDAANNRLRSEISDYSRREAVLEGEVALANAGWESCRARVSVLEDLLTKRQGDDEIRSEIAAVRKVVDENVMAQLTSILLILETRT